MRSMRARMWLGWTIMVAFGAGALIAAYVLHERALDRFDTQEANRAARAASQTEANVNLSVAQLATEAAFFEASQNVTDEEFQIFAQPLLEKTTISATVFVKRVPRSERGAFERNFDFEVLDRHATGFNRAGSRPEYFPVTYASVEPGERSPVLGFDVGSDPSQSEALARARDAGEAAVTPLRPLRLVGGRGLIVYQPIYRTTAGSDDRASRRRELMGFAAGLFRDSDIAQLALAVTPDDHQLQLLENGDPVVGPEQRLADGASASITVADRTWTLIVVDPNEPSPAGPLVLALAGLALTAMLGALLVTWSRRERYANAMVDRRIAERDRAEAERRRSARQYRLLAENASDVISVQDMHGNVRYISPSCEAVLGWTPEQMLGTGVGDYVHPDDREALSAAAMGFSEPGRPVAQQYRCKRSDGTYLWVESTARSVSTEDGELEIHAATRDISVRKAMEQELERLAHEDPLTELVNRRRFELEVEGELARTRRDGGVGALLLLDIDRFKEVNDSLGHGAGDAVLIETAGLLRERLREADVIARLGGDEFAVLLHGSGEQEARLTAESVAKAIREHRFEGAEGRHTSASIGVALFDADPRNSPETLLAEADIAMYAAKRDGRDRVRVYDVDRDAKKGGRTSDEIQPPLESD